LRVSNDIGFRLSNVSKLAEVPMLCEYSFANVTISSAYWYGAQGNLSDCNLKNISFKENVVRFPMDDIEKTESFIVLPDKIKEISYKTTGVLIAAPNLLQLLLPGSRNRYAKSLIINCHSFYKYFFFVYILLSRRMDYKEINKVVPMFSSFLNTR